MRDIRIAAGAVFMAAALGLSPLVHALLIAFIWVLPIALPSVFAPSTDSRRRVWIRLQPFAVIFILISVLMQGVFGLPPRLEVPLVPMSVDGMENGLQTSLRAVLVLSTALLVLLPLNPLELAAFLARLRFPLGVPIALLLSLQLVEDLPRTITSTRSAQLSRGLRFDGSPVARFRALRNIITPVIVRTLEVSIERATALHLRGLTQPILPTPQMLPMSRWSPILYGIAFLLFVSWILEWAGLYTLNG